MQPQIEPPYCPLAELDDQLRQNGFLILSPAELSRWLDADLAALDRLHQAWARLPVDVHLLDGGRYRRRRHGSFVVDPPGTVEQVEHRPHWQPLAYNALHGGLVRWFEPMEDSMTRDPIWTRILLRLADAAAVLHGHQRWYVEAHPFRIDTTDGIGRPTPEGAHRDGVDLVAVFVIERYGIKGGETRVFQADGPNGQRFTLAQPWSLMLLDDARVIHETTPIQPQDPDQLGWRDTLVVTLRSQGFQAAPSPNPA